MAWHEYAGASGAGAFYGLMVVIAHGWADFSPIAALIIVFLLMWVCGGFTENEVMSHLAIDITEHQHQSLKALAALQGKTIKQYAIERLFPGDTDSEQALEDLKNLLDERIREGLSGKVSVKSISEILDDELSGGHRS